MRFRGSGEIESEYSTVVNPQRKMAATEFHRLTDLDVADAPTFARIAADVAHNLSGAVVVAHNLAFEDKFLAAEYRRIGQAAPRWPALCTMVAARAQLDGRAYTLGTVYQSLAGDWLEDHHLALADARASALVLSRMIQGAPSPLRYFGPEPVASARRALAPSRIAPRSGTGGPSKTVLASMAGRLPRTDGSHPKHQARADAYVAQLAKLLEGGRIKNADAVVLEGAARDAGLDQADVRRLNALAWQQAVKAAGELSALSPRQLRTLADAAAGLGSDEEADRYRRLAATSTNAANATNAAGNGGPLKGWRVGLVPGSAQAGAVAQFAVSQGAALAKRLTGTVRILIADDPQGTDTLLDLGRDLGLRILTPTDAKREISAAIDAAAAERHTVLARREERDRASVATWRHRWRAREADPAWGWDEDLVRVKLR